MQKGISEEPTNFESLTPAGADEENRKYVQWAKNV